MDRKGGATQPVGVPAGCSAPSCPLSRVVYDLQRKLWAQLLWCELKNTPTSKEIYIHNLLSSCRDGGNTSRQSVTDSS